MNNDLKQSLMIISNKNIIEYESLRKISVEDFLIKYKIFVDDLEIRNKK